MTLELSNCLLFFKEPLLASYVVTLQLQMGSRTPAETAPSSGAKANHANRKYPVSYCLRYWKVKALLAKDSCEKLVPVLQNESWFSAYFEQHVHSRTPRPGSLLSPSRSICLEELAVRSYERLQRRLHQAWSTQYLGLFQILSVLWTFRLRNVKSNLLYPVHVRLFQRHAKFERFR